MRPLHGEDPARDPPRFPTRRGKLILVTAITPDEREGKTVNTMG